MGEVTYIGWTDHTFNPWEGCTKISLGCKFCYAATRNARFGGGTATNWGPGAPRRRTSIQNWNEPRKWNRKSEQNFMSFNREVQGSFGHLDEMMESPTRPRVFCASLADWLDDEVPIEWLADLLNLIEETPFLDWQLLTKRPQNWETRLKAVCEIDGDSMAWSWLRGNAPANVWFGVSAEDQPNFDERAPYLDKIAAVQHFVSFEPLLGPITVLKGGTVGFDPPEVDVWFPHSIQWGIFGGESGPGARECQQDWIRKLVKEFQAFETKFFVKQLGSQAGLNDSKGGDMSEWPEDLRVQEFPS